MELGSAGCDRPRHVRTTSAFLNFGMDNALHGSDSTPTLPAPLRLLSAHLFLLFRLWLKRLVRHGFKQEEQPHWLSARHPDGGSSSTFAQSPCTFTHTNLVLQPLIAYFVIRNLLARLDPDAQQKEEARAKSAAATRKLDAILTSKRRKSYGEYDSDEEDSHNRRPRMAELQLNSYEQTIAMEVVAPEEIPVTFDDIGGLDSIIEELKESVIYPLTMPHLYSHSSSLLSAPSGVLLYGPPGCGKTMLAKALAHESGACFINLHISTLTEKWYGDSNKLVNAVFSLARKLQPTIVFIDEIDAVLGQRRSGEHEASGMVKAE